MAKGSVALCAVICVLVAAPAQAQEKKDREAELLRRLRQQVQLLQQQVSAEQQRAQQALQEVHQTKAEARAVGARLGGEAQSARVRAQGAEQKVASLQKQLEQAVSDNRELNRQLASAQQSLEERSRVATETGLELKQRDQALTSAQAEVRRLSSGLESCVTRNLALFDLSSEIINRFERRSLGERLSGGEPFFQYGRVKLESLAEGYRDRLYEQQPVSH